jgi:hypothetical protein
MRLYLTHGEVGMILTSLGYSEKNIREYPHPPEYYKFKRAELDELAELKRKIRSYRDKAKGK